MHNISKKIYSIILSAVMFIGLSVVPALAQNFPAPIYDFNYKLYSVDAQTNEILSNVVFWNFNLPGFLGVSYRHFSR